MNSLNFKQMKTVIEFLLVLQTLREFQSKSRLTKNQFSVDQVVGITTKTKVVLVKTTVNPLTLTLRHKVRHNEFHTTHPLVKFYITFFKISCLFRLFPVNSFQFDQRTLRPVTGIYTIIRTNEKFTPTLRSLPHHTSLVLLGEFEKTGVLGKKPSCGTSGPRNLRV